MLVCASCQSANNDDARFCKDCGQLLTPLPRSLPRSNVPVGSLILGAIGLMIWGLASLPWTINANYVYFHIALEKTVYVAFAAGPVLVAIGALVAVAPLWKRIGGGGTILGICGLMLIGLSQLPVVFNSSSAISYRLLNGGPTVGFVLLGVSLLVAIPRVAKK